MGTTEAPPGQGQGFSPGASKYVFVQEVGKGSFGCVVLAKNGETGELVAIKKMVSFF
jgi:serine/threonine protein kinase